ncbi:hypothetical protein CHCC14820_2558 [Bacillus paralicheniformis]|uniref:Uncharacterized protein n=1 Tax=Bacillus paralicheniformis TaxID=1648923 RepID=A0A6N2GYF0_9BACI|nr:hypothetical protein B4121_3285 [Bacillus paralicheniformis]TWJ58510.1 hypothetical protein CHCC5022_3365 [Bacillus paralicheniformis]TWJ60698.1 hypothetical protein CHCC5023_0815 [Bacillus paralicheniformis]TWJ61043.1 hypothetical protein CHCC5021_3799 [Bacillus paralicheniformis]TWJ76106.1 hypothetical protein CHCC4186_1280 [Bacillus paralicheniformis]
MKNKKFYNFELSDRILLNRLIIYSHISPDRLFFNIPMCSAKN